MRVDLRVKHDIEARKAAVELFERGHGFKSAAKALSVPRDTVRQWLYVYRSFGSEVLLSMDGKRARYTYEQKVATASAVVDGGMSKQDAMKAFGVMSIAPLKRWCALYREGGAEQVFGHMKDEFFRGRTWPDFESFKADLDAYVAHWNTRRRQVKLKGLTPEEFQSQPLAA